jgi:hypothetical protein
MQMLVMFLGLTLAAAGHALLHDWRGAIALWEDFDGRFPAAMRTPTPLAGPLLLACGAACVLAPMTG